MALYSLHKADCEVGRQGLEVTRMPPARQSPEDL